MTPDEAIEKLRDLKRYSYQPETEKAEKALELGIEALIVHKWRRQQFSKEYYPPLPGETED